MGRREFFADDKKGGKQWKVSAQCRTHQQHC
jgi:hypothetical protein